ncbi:MAG: PIN domain-containing protein [Actinobacteria bacterium]|nr:PIN domain-containing protein [Actinomycetota bacterium]
MTVLVDTSAVVAALLVDDPNHEAAREHFERLLDDVEELVSHSHAVVETIAVLQRKSGLPAVHDYVLGIEPTIDVVWVDEQRHRRGLAALLTGSRRISLVDHISFQLMRDLGIDTAFAFDGDFRGEGFTVIP